MVREYWLLWFLVLFILIKGYFCYLVDGVYISVIVGVECFLRVSYG